MFKPDEIIFAPTSECNLVCAHCRVTRSEARLRPEDALAFLKKCRPHGIDRVGFSGGEPFLAPDFLCRVSRAAVDLDMTFDRLMTNGAWFDSEESLRTTLAALHEAGYDGTFGVSVDSYHAQDLGDLTAFFRAVFDIWGRKDGCEIAAVVEPGGTLPAEIYEDLAARLGGRLLFEDGEPFSIVNEAFLNRRALVGEPDAPTNATEADPQAELGIPAADLNDVLMINIIRMPYSASADEDAWTASDWFEDDFCRGPGNVFYVHPDGRIAVCCGFANENPQLVVGDIRRDDYRSLMRRASQSAMVKACYVDGLTATRTRLESKGRAFPGKTSDPCFFCDYCSKKGLVG
jgi:MoaA/NifB/PqqE/SkfB family radical SAM enzyme